MATNKGVGFFLIIEYITPFTPYACDFDRLMSLISPDKVFLFLLKKKLRQHPFERVDYENYNEKPVEFSLHSTPKSTYLNRRRTRGGGC